MNIYRLMPFLILSGVCLWGTALAGMIVEVNDPRYFERRQEVIFPWAEVKLVTFEFDAVGDDQRGKQRAKQLHNQFLAKIHDLHGGAIITYVTPPGQQIENYRVKAVEVARQQKAQMVLWGRILMDKNGASLINARLVLIDTPPGVSADYVKTARLSESGPPVEIKGIIDAPVTQLRVDFSTMENDVKSLAYFLSGLARYYKGAARKGNEAKRWLRDSIEDFKVYVAQVPEAVDRAALAQAHLYLARAQLRMADADSQQMARHLDGAKFHAEQAAKLNPYDASIPTVQAVVGARQNVDPAVLRTYLNKAVSLAPTDSNARLNMAVLDSTEGRVTEAIQQLDNASNVQKIQQKAPLKSVQDLRQQLEEYR